MKKFNADAVMNVRSLGDDAITVKNMLNDATVATLNEVVTLEELGKMNQKAVMRTVQGASFIANNTDIRRFDAATAGILAIAYLSGEGVYSTFESVRFALAGVGNEDSKLPKGVQGAKLRKVCGVVPRGTIESKASRTVGKNGFLSALGITCKSDKHGFTVANLSHPFATRYAAALQALTDSAFAKISEELQARNK